MNRTMLTVVLYNELEVDSFFSYHEWVMESFIHSLARVYELLNAVKKHLTK